MPEEIPEAIQRFVEAGAGDDITVYVQSEEPSNPEDGDVWIDPDDRKQ